MGTCRYRSATEGSTFLTSATSSRRYPPRPVLGVGALILRGSQVVLIERGREPLKGFWSIPGGVVEAGETLEEAVRRETLEETGLAVKPVKLVEVFERIMRDNAGGIEYHYVLLDYLCTPLRGRLCASDDCSAAEWVERRNLKRYRLTEGTLEVIKRAFRMR